MLKGVEGAGINCDYLSKVLLIGMVLQDAWIYKNTFTGNIRFGKLDATFEEVVDAATTAHVHPFIQTLGAGYHLVISQEASNISLGKSNC